MSEWDHSPRIEDCLLTRRELLSRSGMGFGMLGLVGVMGAPALLNPSEAAAASPEGAS